jgi:hypothetical protein
MLSTTISFWVAIIAGFFALISIAFNTRNSIFRRIVTVVVILIGFAVPAWIGFVMYVGMKTHQNSARRHGGNETIHKRISDIVLKSYQKCLFSPEALNDGNRTYCYDSLTRSFYSPEDNLCFSSEVEISKHEFTHVTLRNSVSGTTDYSCSIPTLKMAQAFVTHLNLVSKESNFGVLRVHTYPKEGYCCNLNSSTTPLLGETYIYPVGDKLRVTTNVGSNAVSDGIRYKNENEYATSTIGLVVHYK